jgi:UDP-2-acetamido-3-amino-2,3-dideoxy-glucuronate N-acetyltransferase
MKVALIGIGKWGKVLLRELTQVAEVAYQCDSSSDLSYVWNDAEIQAVFIATPTHTHFQLARQALQSGKHVFLEKPGTDSSSKLEELVKLAERKGLVLAIGYEFPHHAVCKKLKELLLNQQIKHIHFHWQKWGSFKDNAVKHLLCHDISILKYLNFADLALSIQHHEAVVSDTDIIWTKFTSTKAEYIESNINRVSPLKQKVLTVIAERGFYIWSNDELFEIVGEELKKIDLPPAPTPVAAEISDFISSIKEKRLPLSNGSFALEIYQIIEQA